MADVSYGDFSAFWGNNPDTDFVYPRLYRDKAKEDMIFEKLDRWIWSLEHDQPPTMENIAPKLAMESLARIYGASNPELATIEFPRTYEPGLRKILALQEKKEMYKSEISKIEEEVEEQSVRIAELMKQHEHGVLETTTDKILIDFVTKKTNRTDTAALKKDYPAIYSSLCKTTESRKLKVSVQAK